MKRLRRRRKRRGEMMQIQNKLMFIRQQPLRIRRLATEGGATSEKILRLFRSHS